MKTLHGNYMQIDSEWYLLSWISPRVKDQVGDFYPRVQLLRRASGCLVEVTGAMHSEVMDQSTLFQRIIVLNYSDIARSLSNAILLLGMGSLADSLTLVRPVLEYMLDIAYLSLHPDEVVGYESKAEEHNLRVTECGPAARNPKDSMRFINSGRMNEKIRKHPDCTDVYRQMVNRYNLVSAVAEHTSPERKTLGLRRLEDWNNVIGVLEEVAFFAFHTLHTMDDAQKLVASLNREFEEVRILLYSEMDYR